MRLYDGDDIVLGGLTGGFEHRLDFNRVVTVIVNDGNTINFASFGKAAFDPGKAVKGGDDFLIGDAQFKGDRDRSQRIGHVMVANHRRCRRVRG